MDQILTSISIAPQSDERYIVKVPERDLDFLLEKLGMSVQLVTQVLNSRTGEIDRKTALQFQGALNSTIGAAAIINQQLLLQDFREEDRHG